MKFFILLLFLFPLSACSQQPADGKFPGARDGCFVYYPPTRSLLLIGGPSAQPNSADSDVWSWNGSEWYRIPAFGPGSRDFFPCAYYSPGKTVYCMGDKDRPGTVFWLFDGNNWSKATINGIGSRDHHQMVYADHLSAFVLYGGANENQQLDTLTWLIKDGKATAINIPGPGVRYHAGMVYDKHRKKVVLYGGGTRPSEFWEFDGQKWERIITTVNPGKKLYHHMVYDEHAKRVILHGGWQNQDPKDPANSLPRDTWSWDGHVWKKITEAMVFPLALGYDPARNEVIAYGRAGHTKDSGFGVWKLREDRWVRIADYGVTEIKTNN